MSYARIALRIAAAILIIGGIAGSIYTAFTDGYVNMP